MRYVKGAPTVTVPESITNTQGAAELYLDALDATAMAYNKMLELGVPAEDARMVLPIGSHTSMVLTMNFRELLHFFELRLDKSAQWEIREVAKRMLSLIRKEAPVIFEGVKIE
jgi:thymidylate synthase (FAD)